MRQAFRPVQVSSVFRLVQHRIVIINVSVQDGLAVDGHQRRLVDGRRRPVSGKEQVGRTRVVILHDTLFAAVLIGRGNRSSAVRSDGDGPVGKILGEVPVVVSR